MYTFNSKNRTFVRLAAAALIVIVCLIVFATLYWNSNADANAWSAGKSRDALTWRAKIFARKAIGKLSDLSWLELWQMMRVRSGFGMRAVIVDGRSLEGSVSNVYTTDEDQAAGARIFLERCAGCHGGDGSGLHGPPLNGLGYRHGDSDLALYKVLRDGIPDTAMVPTDLDFRGRWQVIAHVRSLQPMARVRAPGKAKRVSVQVSSERLRTAGARADEWLTYSGSLDGHRYTPLAQIDVSNVAQLRPLWVQQFETSENKIEATPLVADGVMFITEPPARVVALDVRLGELLWTYDRPVPAELSVCCGRVNRGLAIVGQTIYFGSLDGYLVALDANSGRPIWEAKVAESADGYAMTGAPLIANELVIVGVAGGEFGIRGYVSAFDAATGQPRWKFQTIPGPGEPGHDTWKNDAWRTGGGSTWTAGSFDPSLGIVYWGVGNPAPEFNADVRPGDNLYTDSVVALDVRSGKLVWHFQFTPHDDHDWDSAQTPILADVIVSGAMRKVICWANKNGFYYVLDRATGEFLNAASFVEQNWADRLDKTGRPVLREGDDVSAAGRLTRPGVAGGTNWQNPAYDGQRGLVFVPASEGASVYTKSPDPHRGGRGIYLGSSGSMLRPVRSVVRALDVATGAQRWERYAPPDNAYPSFSGLLATGGGLVFGASAGHLFALDSSTGKERWRIMLGGETLAAPISFTVDGRQVIAVAAGRAIFVFGL